MALADVYDAVRSRRVYKESIPHDEAVAIIIAGKGRHFDPDVVEAFESISDEFKEISDRYSN
jgi:putative two-component system response regulator